MRSWPADVDGCFIGNSSLLITTDQVSSVPSRFGPGPETNGRKRQRTPRSFCQRRLSVRLGLFPVVSTEVSGRVMGRSTGSESNRSPRAGISFWSGIDSSSTRGMRRERPAGRLGCAGMKTAGGGKAADKGFY